MQKFVNGILVNLTQEEILERQREEEEAFISSIPIASGPSLIKFVRSKFLNISIKDQTILMSLLQPLMLVLNHEKYQEINQQEVVEISETVDFLIQDTVLRDQFKNIFSEYLSTVRLGV